MGNGNFSQYGDLYIELLNDKVSFAPGEIIQGTVHANVTQTHKTSQFVIELVGIENTIF